MILALGIATKAPHLRGCGWVLGEMLRFQGLDDKENAYLLNAVTLRDPDAAALLANRYYWGSHGLEQNHPEAFRLYDQARRANNMQGTIGAAKMLLKVCVCVCFGELCHAKETPVNDTAIGHKGSWPYT